MFDERPKNLLLDLKKLIIRTLRIEDLDPSDIGDSEPLSESGYDIDSIDLLELVVAIETEYGVVIPDEEVAYRAFATIEALASFILEERAAQENSNAVG
jgi:acyl carrier protein